MLKVDLYKDASGQSSPVTLILPASRWDVLEATTRLGVDDLHECYPSFEAPADVPQAGAVLKNMHQDLSFFDELNYFAYRLTEMSHSERILLNGAIAIHGPDSLKGLINLTWHTDNIVLGEVESDAELGRFLLENDMVSFPEEAIPYLDFAKIGQQHRADNSCAFDRHIYYEDLEPVIEEVYDGYNLPTIPDDYIFKVTICHFDAERQDSLWAELKLPATEGKISSMLDKIDAVGVEDAIIRNGHSQIKLFSGLINTYVDLTELDMLATIVDGLDDPGYIKLMAVLENNQVFMNEGIPVEYPSLSEILKCAQQLDEYDFNPVITAADIGSYGFIRHTGPVQEMAQVDTPQQTNEIEMGGF